MIWSKDDPAAEGVAEVDDPGADHKPDDVGQRPLQGQDEHVVRVEEPEVPVRGGRKVGFTIYSSCITVFAKKKDFSISLIVSDVI